MSGPNAKQVVSAVARTTAQKHESRCLPGWFTYTALPAPKRGARFDLSR